MAVTYYDKAEIYLTSCTHPDYSHLRYVGLDCKCDPNYLGSSVTLKWWINKLGRSYFTKEILRTTKGTMREVCAVEQRYIRRHNAVKDPNYLNMNGGTKIPTQEEELIVDLNYVVRPLTPLTHTFVSEIVNSIRNSIPFYSHAKQQLVRRVVGMVCYGYLKYGQESFNYSRYTYYGSCNEEDLQNILAALSNTGILDSGFSDIKITEQFIEELPVGVTYSDFSVKTN